MKGRIILEYNKYEMTIMYRTEYFNLGNTLNSGQCFRFYPVGDHEYIVIAMGRMLKLREEPEGVLFFCNEDDFNTIWVPYFNLQMDYPAIVSEFSTKDTHLEAAFTEKHGIRVLKQEPFEMLISFIISQSKQIPHIKKLIEDLSNSFGTSIGKVNGKTVYAFPSPQDLSHASEEDLRRLKLGYRAAYIHDAVHKIVTGELSLSEIHEMPYSEGKSKLMTIHGVGEKVADCVLLFGYNQYEAFPVDVWVKRVMETLYFGKSSHPAEIRSFAKEYFGEYAGIAQQVLFYYARDNKLGK